MTVTSSSAGSSQLDRARLLVTMGTAALVLLLAEWGSTRLVSEAPATAGETQRPVNVIIVPNAPGQLPVAKDEPSVWLLGNSHTYALPGIAQGDALRTEAKGILIEELAARVRQHSPDVRAEFYQLAYPNFLPFEMLTRVGHLLQHGHRPTVVFLGLTWRNIARDSQLRHAVHAAYRDPSFSDAFTAMLTEANVEADPLIIERIQAQRTQGDHEIELERMRSDSDRIDELLTTWAAEHLTLMGKSAELRGQIFRALTDRLQEFWVDRKSVKYTYDLVESDYKFNVECLRAIVKLLRQNGATVICYYAPERTDLPPLLDPAKQNEFIAQFDREAEELGVVVIDARRAVPNEYWGWVGDSPDRSHFTDPGHQRLAQFLWEEALKRSAWKELARP